jgi:hypothetical protein
VNRTFRTLKALAIPALFSLTVAACGEDPGEFEQACLKAGQSSDKQCACIQKVADDMIKEDPESAPLLHAMATNDKKAMQELSTSKGPLTALEILGTFATNAAQKCEILSK